MTYSVTIVNVGIHHQCFQEVAETIAKGLYELGAGDGEVRLGRYHGSATNIVLGWNLLPWTPEKPPLGSILYNLEQVSPESQWFQFSNLALLRAFSVLDYSPRNILALAEMGIVAKLLPVGYHPVLTRGWPEVEKDVDVLFVGSENERRTRVLNGLSEKGLRVESLFGVYGRERDQWFNRAKIVLNMHYYDAKVFEVVRCSYLLANKCFVVSETGDPEGEAPFADSILLCPYEELVDACVRALAEPEICRERAERGLRIMEGRRIERFLKEALT